MSTYYGITLDPLHIGAGGYRLGRVDNTIIRDAASGLPKVPGSSLAGVVRSYAALLEQNDDKVYTCMTGTSVKGDENDPKKAKKQRDAAKGSCGKCKICKLFGHASDGESTGSHIGLLRFYDGRIIAFPVRTLHGPVWVVSPSTLLHSGIRLEELPEEEELLVNFTVPPAAGDRQARLNLGWLYLPVREMEDGAVLAPMSRRLAHIMPEAQIAVAPDWLFAEIVNSGLEVRTSVSIDPETGAASEGKLFTYEAVPAAALLAFDISLDTLRLKEEQRREADELVEKALEQCALLGMGGMTTRGFGRIRFFREQEDM